MSLFEVLDRYGTAALLRLAGVLVLFLVVHLLRLPVVLLARVLEVFARRVDGWARDIGPPDSPINHFYATTVVTEEACNVHA